MGFLNVGSSNRGENVFLFVENSYLGKRKRKKKTNLAVMQKHMLSFRSMTADDT